MQWFGFLVIEELKYPSPVAFAQGFGLQLLQNR